ncbi:MAG TPA: hypothetical protein VGC79_08030 [Polyangiaceae bacterium]
MSKARWLAFAPLTFALASALLGACGGDGRPDSLVSSGGQSANGGGSAGRGGGGSPGDAGQGGGEGGDAGEDEDASAGAAGEATLSAAPIAVYPQQLQVDVGCGASTKPAELVIRNGGLLPLTITSATTSAGYEVKTQLPLQIEAMASATLSVAPPAAKANATIGEMSTGALTFLTNEPDAPSHEVLLNSTLFGGQFEFTDRNGTPLSTALALTYLSSTACPDDVTYRVHNTGNRAFTLFGPTFPSHLGGTSTAASGQAVPPDQYLEFTVGGNSASDGACSASGSLTFTVQGSFCGSVPKLAVTWPTNVETAGCTCTAAVE